MPTSSEKTEALKRIRDEVSALKDSPLYRYRTENSYFPVPGEGSVDSKVLFVGEAPGENEAKSGVPFCGAAGRILDELFASIGMDRRETFVTSVVKDRPQGNRDPKPEEIALYGPFLERQIETIQPEAIVTLGKHSMEYVFKAYGLGSKIQPISKIHGKAFIGKTPYGKAAIIPLYHPAFALYNGSMKATLLKDFKLLKRYIKAMPKTVKETPEKMLARLNRTYAKLHTRYEEAYWTSYMGDHSVKDELTEAQVARDGFRSDARLLVDVSAMASKAKGAAKEGLHIWEKFFSLYQTPPQVLSIRKEIADIEGEISKIRGERMEGYKDPKTGAFVEASENKMRTLMATNPDEAVRRACMEALNELPHTTLDLYVKLVGKRNEYARALGFEDFYAYKLSIEEGMTKEELFGILDPIYEKTKYAFDDIRALEKKMPGLRKPWNFSFMMAGSFVREEDPYFQFDQALMHWGKSFAALGVDCAQGSITLDLLDRKGKHNNGFCHWPQVIEYKKGKRIPGKSNFTCNVVPGQVGSGVQGLDTLFHEGGHAVHFLNITERQTCLATEYPPAAASWAETQSMFMDSISSSIEWRVRYAKNAQGEPYPFDLFERKLRKVHILRPLGIMGIIFVANFERKIYEEKHLTKEKALEISYWAYKKYFDKEGKYLQALNVPHIYAWESTASYHGYGLAELAVCQWREYFFDKYGYIVDNPNVGKEMKKVWKYGSRYAPKEMVRMATGKPLSPEAYIKNVTKPIDEILKSAKQKIARLEKVKPFKGKIDLKAKIRLVHGKQKIADNAKGFEKMAEDYKKWLDTQKES